MELPAEDAPWGHDGLPTVPEAARAHPFFATFVCVFPAFAVGMLFQEMRNEWAIYAIPFAPGMWWVLMWLHIRGWINFDD